VALPGDVIAAAPRAAGLPAAAIQQPGKATDDNGDTIVYITKTCKKYHADGCRSLSKSRIPIKLRDAVARGFTACLLCKPPALKAGQEAALPSTAAPLAPAARTTAAQDNGDTTVYITRTGAKYHRAGCRSLSRSMIPIKLRDAVAEGYGACKLCNPPTLQKK
jgi:methylphosphotriester-DNA--protein-cysteine methyltransferase